MPEKNTGVAYARIALTRRPASVLLSRRAAAIPAERDADRERDDQRVERELERRGAVGGQHLGDRPVVGDRRPEVPVQDLPEVLEVLREERAVVAGGVHALGQLVGGQPATEGRGDRVTGGPHQHEHRGHEDEDRGEDQQEPHQQVPAEAAAAALLLRRVRRGGRLAGRYVVGRAGEGRGHGSCLCSLLSVSRCAAVARWTGRSDVRSARPRSVVCVSSSRERRTGT